MMQRAVAMLIALGMLLFCSIRASAQEVITLPSGGLHRIRADDFDRLLGVRFETLTVTLLPKKSIGVLYLDSKPLEAYRPLSREEADRLMLFSTKSKKTVSIGVTIPAQLQKTLKIRCINRQN